MKKDDFTTEVIFRKVKSGDFKGDIEAWFPYFIADLKGNVMTYEHLGQHSAGSWDYLLFNTVPAKENEFKDLKRELEYSYGYNLKVVKKRNHTRFLAELNRIRNQK